MCAAVVCALRRARVRGAVPVTPALEWILLVALLSSGSVGAPHAQERAGTAQARPAAAKPHRPPADAVPAGCPQYSGGFTLVEVPDPLAAQNPTYSLVPRAVPAPGECFSDARFGTVVRRLTTIDGTNGRHEYSRFDPWNADRTRIMLLHSGGGYEIYRTTGSLPYNQGANLEAVLTSVGEARWDATDPDLIWGLEDFSIVTVRVSTAQQTTIKNFATDPVLQPLIAVGNTYRITMKDEGEASQDCRYWAFMLQGNDQVEYRPMYLFSWDRQTDTVLGVYPQGHPLDATTEAEIDWVGMSPLGNWVLVGGMHTNTGNLVGLTMASKDFTQFNRLDYTTSHSDVGLDTAGREVVVMQNSRTDYVDLIPIALTTRPIMNAGDTYDGTGHVKLIRLYYDSGSPDGLGSGVHLSCNTSGYCFVSTTIAPGTPEQNWLDRSLLLVRLDQAHPRVFYLAKLYNTTSEQPRIYWDETHGTMSRDGSRLAWADNWGQDVGQERVFMVELIMPANWRALTGETLPTLTSSPAAVNIGAVNSGGTLTSVTPAQTVTVSQSGGAGVAWTASADVSWLTIAAADAVGNGTGTFTVTLNNTGNVLPAAGIVNGTITITAPGAASNPTIPVTATLYAPGGTLPPFGLTSSPDQNAAGVQGAVGITGWVLDDVGIERVRLYRNCLGFEDQNACQVVAGQSVVWMGDATLVAGARPDIEGAYPAYPQHNRAGFGYAMLSNLSPHIPNQAMFGGQGPLTIFIRARDIEGNEAWVGRNFVGGSTTLSDEVPTAITMANDTIAKPFGTIDTPTQGQTVSGALWNWGWALTPDSNAIAGDAGAAGDAGDILIPTNGSTITVWIDGAARGTVTYNQCRGAMAPFCIDDIASIFGNPTPQPIGTPRANNPTVFRNLDANRGAIGGFFLNTATYTNAVHTIAWAAYDNAAPARGDGLGSRYFTVLNTGTDADRRQATGDRRQGEDRDLGSGASSVTLARRDTTDPRSPVPDPGLAADVRGRTGFSLDAPFVELVPDAEGVRHVQMAEMGRLELQFAGLVESGYLVVNNAYRALPVGSQFDAATGTFTWAPGVGFIGTYRLAFPRTTPALERESVAAGDRAVSGPRSRVPDPDAVLVLVDVTIRPATPPAPGDAALRMHLDTPQPGATVSGSFLVAGWALDPHAAIGSGIGAVHVWAQRTDVPGSAPVFLGAATLDGARSDVGGIFGAQFSSAGFNLAVPVLAPGTYDVTAYIWNTRTARWEDARTAHVIVR